MPAPWRSPLQVWKLCLVTALTLGFYGFWWIYRAACDLRARTGENIRPSLYPVALILAIAFPFAILNLAQLAERLHPPRTRRRYDPFWIAAAASVTLLVYVVAEFVPYPSAALLSIVPLAATLALLQGRINELARAEPAAQFARTAWRTTPWQIAGMIIGSLVLAASVIFTAPLDWARLRGQELAPGERFYTDAGFQITAPTSGWVQVAPSVLDSDGVLALIGPVPDSWAVLHVYPTRDYTIDTIIADRRTMTRDLTFDAELDVVESRRLADGSDEVEAWATYSGKDIVMQGFTMYVNTLEAGDEIGELVVYTPATRKSRTGAEKLARSLR